MSLILVGLPDLWDRMELKKNRSLWSRIHVRLSLGEALPADTVEYVEHRMSQAGGRSGPFSSDALSILHEATDGHLREIDRLAVSALRLAARRKLKRVDRELITDVASRMMPLSPA